MKILHTADWHINFRKHKEFEQYRFKLFVNELIISLKNVEILCILGDIFDKKTPKYDELLEYFNTIYRIVNETNVQKIIVVQGNHEDINAFYSVHQFLDILFPNKFVYTYDILEYSYKGVNFLLANNKDVRIGNELKPKTSNCILLSHIRNNGNNYKEEYSFKELSETFKLVLLGDIHTLFDTEFPNIFYSSSPYNTKFKTIETLEDIQKTDNGYNIVKINTDNDGNIGVNDNVNDNVKNDNTNNTIKIGNQVYKLISTDNIKVCRKMLDLPNKYKIYTNDKIDNMFEYKTNCFHLIEAIPVIKKVLKEKENKAIELTKFDIISAVEKYVTENFKGTNVPQIVQQFKEILIELEEI